MIRLKLFLSDNCYGIDLCDESGRILYVTGFSRNDRPVVVMGADKVFLLYETHGLLYLEVINMPDFSHEKDVVIEGVILQNYRECCAGLGIGRKISYLLSL